MPKPSVILVDRSNLEHWEAIKPIIEEFSFIVNTKVHVSNPHQHPSDIEKNLKDFYIKFWSYPKGCVSPGTWKYKTEKCRVFGSLLEEGQPDGFNPPKKGKVIFSPEKIPVAVLLDTTLFVLFDLPHGLHPENTAQKMKGLLDKTLSLIMTKKEIEMRQKEILKNSGSRMKEKYVKMCLSRRTNEIARVQNELSNFKIQAENIQRQYIEAIRRVSSMEEQAQMLKNLNEQDKKDRLEIDFDHILKFPKVKDVKVSETGLIVTTDVLHTQRLRSGIRNLGRFQLDINTDGRHLRIRNLDRNPEGFPHPHVDQSGNPCLGNIRDAVYKLIAGYKFAPVVDILIKYLQTINESDRHPVSPSRWPKVKEGKAK